MNFPMKNYSYTFSIDKPCSEAWDQMTTSEKGKFCKSCQHEVIDFSSLRDDEIIRVIEKAMGNVCGRFENKQLSRPMQLSAYIQRPSSIRAIVAGIIMLTIISPSIVDARPQVSIQETAIFSAENRNEVLPGS